MIVVIIDTPEIPKAIDGENRLDIAPKKNPPNGVKPKVIPYSPKTRPRISSVHNNCNKDPIEASYDIKKAPIINERMKDNITKNIPDMKDILSLICLSIFSLIIDFF